MTISDKEIKKYTKKDLIDRYNKLVNEQDELKLTLKLKDQAINDLKGEISETRGSLNEKYREISRLKEKINSLQIDRIADIKAAKYLISVSDSGLTHRQKSSYSSTSLKVLDKKAEEIKNHIELSEGLPF